MKFIAVVTTSLILMIAFAGARQGGFDHSQWDRILKQYSDNGLVDYQGLQENHQVLQEYLTALESVSPSELEAWNREEQMAFWINAYNAITIEGILRNYPIKYGGLVARLRFPRSSIRQIGDFWDTVFIKPAGKAVTLNDIEHKILRGQFKDPRVHFALVCASIGCPNLRREAYTAERLDRQLEEDAYRFINDSRKVKLDRDSNILYLSSIFDWYSSDFVTNENSKTHFAEYDSSYQGVLEFISKYLSQADTAYIINERPKIKFLKYDWSLNEKP